MLTWLAVKHKPVSTPAGFGVHPPGGGFRAGRDLYDFLRRVSCGRCGRQPKARFVRLVNVSRSWEGSRASLTPVELWQWRCRCGADWQVSKASLARHPRWDVVLGVDLG